MYKEIKIKNRDYKYYFDNLIKAKKKQKQTFIN